VITLSYRRHRPRRCGRDYSDTCLAVPVGHSESYHRAGRPDLVNAPRSATAGCGFARWRRAAAGPHGDRHRQARQYSVLASAALEARRGNFARRQGAVVETNASSEVQIARELNVCQSAVTLHARRIAERPRTRNSILPDRRLNGASRVDIEQPVCGVCFRYRGRRTKNMYGFVRLVFFEGHRLGGKAHSVGPLSGEDGGHILLGGARIFGLVFTRCVCGRAKSENRWMPRRSPVLRGDGLRRPSIVE
jgi:hypothetical protein